MEPYQKIQQPYHKEVQNIWKGHIVVEEKIDGSQFRIEIIKNGEISCGSHHQELSMVDSMFKLGTDQAQEIFKSLPENMTGADKITVFCEYLSKPKQNTIAYSRTPGKNLVVFDVMYDDKYLNRKLKENFVNLYEGLEITPLLWEGEGKDFTDEIKAEILLKPSYLGHQGGYDKVEGIVVKAYDNYYDVNRYPYLQGQWLCTKIVNESFQEKNKVENPGVGGKMQKLKDSVNSEARWRKAVQHLKERGELLNEMKDMAKLAPEVQNDLLEEEKENIKEELWKLYGKSIIHNSIKGLPEWYKEQLVENVK